LLTGIPATEKNFTGRFLFNVFPTSLEVNIIAALGPGSVSHKPLRTDKVTIS
jgi:hypothetical protein